MFAVIRTGGKQYKVQKDDIIEVEKLAGEAGDVVAIDDVLFVNDGKKATVGAPVVKGASVSATLVKQKRADKIVIFKKKRRQNYRRKKGHRQNLTVLKITDIKAA
ncbi:MAG: 50S ribosomal protein L21 [Alphaproteobacteria bacterium]|nr:50S ribosomal protein L21 [Alphaproteobacteria bacterium]HCQ70885.1 50S ribosomal protein L21 [Rhodospirillaceae bacterium]|tara:strand:+ start:8186 stop:8500 length:315 start_codon:yes stop_codon:yes gene_type:complete